MREGVAHAPHGALTAGSRSGPRGMSQAFRQNSMVLTASGMG